MAVYKLPYPTAAEEKKLKPYPFNDMGSRDNSAIRMIRMAKPECPIDGVMELKQKMAAQNLPLAPPVH